jgi:hypothetical protein
MGSAQLSPEYLVSSPEISLKNLELARSNSIAELRTVVLRLVDEWIEAEVELRVARGILGLRQNGDPPRTQPLSTVHPCKRLAPHSAQDLETVSSPSKSNQFPAASRPQGFACPAPGVRPANPRIPHRLNSDVDLKTSRDSGDARGIAKLDAIATQPCRTHLLPGRGICDCRFAARNVADTSRQKHARKMSFRTYPPFPPVKIPRTPHVRKLARIQIPSSRALEVRGRSGCSRF